MGNPAECSEDEFIALFRQLGGTRLAKRLGTDERAIMRRRAKIEARRGIDIASPDMRTTRVESNHPQRVVLEIKNGQALIGSDAHLWPGDRSLAQRAFLKFAKELKPKTIILNGDVLDFPQISKHSPIGWEKHPTVQEEIEHAQNYLSELELAGGRGVHKIWTLGNHDARFATRLAERAKEYALIHGMHLKDHFPAWEPCWSVFINDDVVVKHRWKGGMHATHNNAVASGRTMVTGHLHSQKVTPVTDYNGDRYGVDTGCLADINARQFVDYTEDGPKNWRSGFAVLTFRDGKLLPPELVTAWGENSVVFRGEVIRA
jgi:hypothetical protein